MSLVFGPVPSRRLGQSLGIDTIPPKTCNWNCTYCQLGRSVPLTNERREYYPREDILVEVERALAEHAGAEIDWVTFVGSGEPTLHVDIGWLIRRVQMLTDLPVAIITNGALLYLPEVRQELSAADAVLPSLDAGNARLYRKVNRPWPKLTFEQHLNGLTAFRKMYSGKLWIEVMLVRGINDTERELNEIAAALNQIQPDEVHINVPTRPPAEQWVEPPDQEGLMRALALLGKNAKIVHPARGTFRLEGSADVTETILNIITRHPMDEQDLIETLKKWTPDRVEAALDALIASKRAQIVERYGRRFWSASDAHYPK